MNADELSPDSVTHDATTGKQLRALCVSKVLRNKPVVFLFTGNAISIEKGSFSWSPEEPPILKDINIEIKTGKLVAVVGQVGAGKSSLIAAMLGEMEKLGGRTNTNGRIAYIPQQAWIQNCSLRNNILFGKSFNETTYNKVVHSCALKPDISMLPGGDATEIGEKVGIILVFMSASIHEEKHSRILGYQLKWWTKATCQFGSCSLR